MNDLSLNGKVALITGASSGIGEATAKLFARRGAKLALTGRNEVNLHRVKDECIVILGPDGAEHPLTVIVEMSCEADVINLVDTTIKKFGRLDILVNSAGIFERGSIETTSLEQFDRVMTVNVRSVYQLTMLCVPHLIATRGNIVNVSSRYGTHPVPGHIASCVSKSATDQMTNCMALELAGKGVRVNCVKPGAICTPILKRFGMTDDDIAKYCEHQTEVIPLGRVGEADEVAQAIAFLASTDASFITAEHIHIDGGWHATCAS